MYMEFVDYRFLIFFWMKPPCFWHTVMTVTVPLNEITGISRISGHEGDQVVSPVYWSPLPPRRYSWYTHFCYRLSWLRPYQLLKENSDQCNYLTQESNTSLSFHPNCVLVFNKPTNDPTTEHILIEVKIHLHVPATKKKPPPSGR